MPVCIRGYINPGWVDQRCRLFALFMSERLDAYIFQSNRLITSFKCTQEEYDRASRLTRISSTILDYTNDPELKGVVDDYHKYLENAYKTMGEAQQFLDKILNVIHERQVNDSDLQFLRLLGVAQGYDHCTFESVENISTYSLEVNKYEKLIILAKK